MSQNVLEQNHTSQIYSFRKQGSSWYDDKKYENIILSTVSIDKKRTLFIQLLVWGYQLTLLTNTLFSGCIMLHLL